MADISISKSRGKKYIGGSSPMVPAFIVGDDPIPLNPPGSTTSHSPVTIGTPANGLSLVGQELSLGIGAGLGIDGSGNLEATGTSKWTDVGSDIYRNSAVAIGRTTIPSNSTFAVQSITTTGTHKFISLLDSGGVEVFNIREDGSGRFDATSNVGSWAAFEVKNLNTNVNSKIQSWYNDTSTEVANISNSFVNFSKRVQITDSGIVGGAAPLTVTNSNTNVFSPVFRIIGSGSAIFLTVFESKIFDFIEGTTFKLGTTTGTKIGTATTQKLAFWNKTPIIQPTTGITGATLVGGGGTTITDTDTFGGYTLQQIAAALINTGILA